jgi:hypothetical protein
MKNKICFFIFTIQFLFSCNSKDKIKQDNYLKYLIKKFDIQIELYGSRPKDRKIKEKLNRELDSVELAYKGKSELETDEFISKLKIIEDNKKLLAEDLFLFQNITPYIINTKKDSSVILFNLEPVGHYPNVFINSSDSARQLTVENYLPLTVNLKTPKFSNSNYAIPKILNGIGLYSAGHNGYDKNIEIIHDEKSLK